MSTPVWRRQYREYPPLFSGDKPKKVPEDELTLGVWYEAAEATELEECRRVLIIRNAAAQHRGVPAPLPPDQIKPLPTSVGIEEGRGSGGDQLGHSLRELAHKSWRGFL